jgi:thioredoxin reductase (NADPH)
MSKLVDSTVDALVVGGGIAGLSAAGILAEQGFRVTVADEMCAGGRLINIGSVRNFPGGEESLTGPDLSARCIEAALDNGVELLPTRVLGLDRNDLWRAETTDGSVDARVVVVATGRTADVAGTPGAAALSGRGVSYCASCDGPLFAGQQVVVAGSGWWLPTEVEVLAGFAQTVTVVLPGDRPAGPDHLWAKIMDLANVHVVTHAHIVDLAPSDNGLDGLTIETSADGAREISTTVLFLCEDQLPSVPAGLDDILDPSGAVSYSEGTRTSLAGLFAAGDARANSTPYLVCAAADGVQAGLAAGSYLSKTLFRPTDSSAARARATRLGLGYQGNPSWARSSTLASPGLV